jgi:hypothetical protein
VNLIKYRSLDKVCVATERYDDRRVRWSLWLFCGRDVISAGSASTFATHQEVRQASVVGIGLTLQRSVNCLPEPQKRLDFSFAIKKWHLDIENPKERICLVFSACSLSAFCLGESFIDVELGEAVFSKRRGRDSSNLVDLLLESSLIT